MARTTKRRDRDQLPRGCRWKGTTIEWRRMRRGITESRMFGSPSEAWEFLRDLEAVERGAALGITQTARAPRTIFVGEIIDWYQRTYLNTARLRKRSMKLDAAARAFGKLSLDALQPKDVAAWIEQLANEPIARRHDNGTTVLVRDRATGELKYRGPDNLADYLYLLSSALRWHAQDHGYIEGYLNAALQAAPGLRQRGIIKGPKTQKNRKRRFREGEEAALFKAAREYVASGAATLITRQRTPRKWDIGLALELARFAPITGRRITELAPSDVSFDVAGRAVAVRLEADGEPTKIPRRIGRELEALVRSHPDRRLFPVGRQEPPKALNRLCRALDWPALLWTGLAAYECSSGEWQRLIFESRRNRDEYHTRGRQRITLPMMEFYRFALAQGFRPGEIAALRWSDIQLSPIPRVHLVHDPAAGRSLKGGKADDRWVPLREDAIGALESLTTDRSPESLVFGASYQTFQARHRRIRILAGSDWTLHMFRHEALSRLGELGFGLPDLQVFSGHSDLRELNTYVHGSLEALERRLATLDKSHVA